MNVRFRASFTKDLRAISDKALLGRVREIIEAIEQASSLHDLQGLKRLRAQGRFYRIRVGDYRLGLTVEGDTVDAVRFLHRREIYDYFPR